MAIKIGIIRFVLIIAEDLVSYVLSALLLYFTVVCVEFLGVSGIVSVHVLDIGIYWPVIFAGLAFFCFCPILNKSVIARYLRKIAICPLCFEGGENVRYNDGAALYVYSEPTREIA